MDQNYLFKVSSVSDCPLVDSRLHVYVLTGRSIHDATVTDDETVPWTRVGQIKVRVLYLHHCLDKVLLELVGCKYNYTNDFDKTTIFKEN